jgi:hypothetical protein
MSSFDEKDNVGRASVRRTFTTHGPTLPPTGAAAVSPTNLRRLSMSASNLLATQPFSRHGLTQTQGPGGSKRRLSGLQLGSNPGSGGSLSRKQVERQNSIKSRYSNKSIKSARHDDEQLYAREDGEVEIEELGSHVTEQVDGNVARLSKKPRTEWAVADDAAAETVEAPASPSPSKLRVQWVRPRALLRSGSLFSAHYRIACWLGVLILHLVCAILYALLAALNTKLLRTELSVVLRKYTPDLRDFSAFSIATCIFSSVLAAIHGVATVRMVYRSLRNRELMYYAPNYFSAARSDQIMPFSVSMRALTGVAPTNSRAPRPTTRNVLKSLVLKCWWMFQEMLWARRDLVELNYTGPSERMYRTTLIGQTLVHFAEAVVMSHLVGASWMQYVYVVFVIANAWVPLALTLLRNAQLILWHSHRIASLLISIVLDVFGVLVVPAILIQSYSSDYDVSTENFSKRRWLCDRWLMKMLLEIQFLLAVNTLSLVLRLLMGLHLLSSLNALKSLLESVTSSRPPIPSTERSVSGSPTKSAFRRARIIKIKPGARVTVILEVLLVLTGVVMMTGHLDAKSKSHDSKACPLPLRPLFSVASICPLLELNCAKNPVATGGGDGADMERLLTGIDRESVRHFVIRACPRVQIGRGICELPRLLDFKISHSTLDSWPADTALSQLSHPEIHRFGAVDVSMTELPAGLLSSEFPPTLVEINLCGTNLSSLPVNLFEKWRHVEALTIELSGINSVPETVLHMKALRALSLRGNNVSFLPAELLSKPALVELSLSRNPIKSLPSDVVETPLQLLALVGTEIRTIPDWVSAKPGRRVLMGATPYCDNLDTATKDLHAPGVDCTAQPDEMLFPLLTAE